MIDKASGFGYDRLNRRTEQTTPATATTSDTLRMGYDGAGNMTGYSDELAGEPVHSVSYGYDSANRPTSVIEGGDTISIGTDADGKTTRIGFVKTGTVAGVEVNYTWTKDDAPKTMDLRDVSNASRGLVTYSYKKGSKDTSQQQSRKVENSIYADQNDTWSYGYDHQRLTSADAKSASGTDYNYSYDKIGNLTRESVGSATTYFGYDKVGQLCYSRATPGDGTTPLECAPVPNGITGYSSDKAGNSLGTTANSYGVNDRNQVTKVDGKTQSYLDQGNDLRATNDTTREINSPNGVTAQKTTAGIVTYIVRAPDGTLLTNRTTNKTRINYITEPNGTVSWLTGEDGKVSGGYRYAPYGNAATYGTDGPRQPLPLARSAAERRHQWRTRPLQVRRPLLRHPRPLHPTRPPRRRHDRPPHHEQLQLRRRRPDQPGRCQRDEVLGGRLVDLRRDLLRGVSRPRR